MKNKTKLTRPTRQPRRFPNAQPTPAMLPTAATTDQRQDFLILCFYPGMPTRPDAPVAA